MSREINLNQLNPTLLHINRLVEKCFALEIQRSEKTQQYPQALPVAWSKENLQRWKEEFPRLFDMATVENFSGALDALNKALEQLRDEPK